MYRALYRTWRPQTFDDVVGQPGVTQTLRAQVESGRLSHAYLFTGTRGTGKTTCAKILAKAVNCLHPRDGSPCNQCAACRSIDAGSSLDVQEIDAASNNGVENVRTLRDEAVYTPAELKYRVYIIDEVHMLSTAAFNALLKIIEEPPEHLIFILATTELNKVPATILSRCQRFSFRRLSQEDLAGRINQVAYAEGIDIDTEAIRVLARLGDGAMRDALSLLDQCASAVNGTLTAEAIYDVLGLAGSRKTAALLQAAARHDARTALKEFAQVYEAGKSIASVLDELASLTRDLLLETMMPGGAEDLVSGICTLQERQALLPLVNAGELTYWLGQLQQTQAGFAQTSDPRMAAELCLLRLCDPTLQLDAEAMNARLSRLEDQLASGVMVARSPAAAPAEEDAPPPPEEEWLPPEEEPPAPQQDPGVPDSFWLQLTEKMRAELQAPAKAFFVANPQGEQPLHWQLKDDGLTLYATPFAFNYVSKLPEMISQKAAAILGRPIRVQVKQQSEQTQTEDPAFDAFARRARELDQEAQVIKFTGKQH